MMDTHLYISACVVLTPPVIGDIGMTPGYGITAGYRWLLCFDTVFCSEALKIQFKTRSRTTTFRIIAPRDQISIFGKEELSKEKDNFRTEKYENLAG